MADEPGSPPNGVIIRLNGISRRHGETVAVRSVDLNVRQGEFLAIVGPSGAGKSTLLNVIGLLDTPSTGRYLLDGIDVADVGERERDRLRGRTFGFVFQFAHVLGDESALANAAMGLRIIGLPARARGPIAARALAELDLTQRSDVPAKLLSGGERQRLAIARAVATRPSIVLADEPTGNLDSGNGRAVIDHLHALHRQGTTVVVVTHDHEVARAADRAVTIRDGVIVGDTSRAGRPASETGPDAAVRQPAAPTSSGPSIAGPAREAARRPGATRTPWPPQRMATALIDDVTDAVNGLQARCVRAALLVVAFAVGVGGLLAGVGLTETASSQISGLIAASALDEVLVTMDDPSERLEDPEELAVTAKRVRALDHVRGVGYIAEVAPREARVTRLGPTGDAPPEAIGAAHITAGVIDLGEMRITPPGVESLLDVPAAGSVALVTPVAATALGFDPDRVPAPGSQVWIHGRAVPVVGIAHPSDRTVGLTSTVIVSRSLIVTLPEVRLTMRIRTDEGFPAAVAEAAVLAIDPANPAGVSVETVADLRSLRVRVASDLGALVGSLSTVLLVLIVLSASTAMYLSVQARTAEIALRRAIGASRGLVARVFLAEGMILGLSGGATGTAVGVAATLAVSFIRGWQPVLPAALPVLGMLIGVSTGLVSALYPAWVAARKEPALAVRG